jgi:hypothetical protein
MDIAMAESMYDEKLLLRLTGEQKKQIKAYAKSRNLKVSVAIRLLLDEALKKGNKTA